MAPKGSYENFRTLLLFNIVTVHMSLVFPSEPTLCGGWGGLLLFLLYRSLLLPPPAFPLYLVAEILCMMYLCTVFVVSRSNKHLQVLHTQNFDVFAYAH